MFIFERSKVARPCSHANSLPVLKSHFVDCKIAISFSRNQLFLLSQTAFRILCVLRSTFHILRSTSYMRIRRVPRG